MNDLIRPALYGAAHPVLCVVPPRSRQRVKADLVGPICESADTFFEGIPMPPLESGALLAFTNAGAYGMSMASQYNSRPRAAEVLIDGTQTSLIRSRESYADLVQHELL
jgi:diaminopimelate decarboxylase